MTVVSGPLIVATSSPAAITQVWLRVPQPRLHGNAYVTDMPDTVSVNNGQVSFTAIPGPLLMVLVTPQGPAKSVKLIVPDKATATLRECIEAAGLADDGTLNALESLSAEVSAIANSIASAGQLDEWATQTSKNAQDAIEAADRAENAAESLGVDSTILGVISNPDTQSNTWIRNTMGSAPLTVYHGDNASTARPDTDRPVFWVGSVLPRNRTQGDIVAMANQEWSPGQLDLLGWYDAVQEGSTSGTVDVIPDRGVRGHDLRNTSFQSGVTLGDIGGRPAYAFPGSVGGIFSTSTAGYDPGLWEASVTVFAVCQVAVDQYGAIFDSAHAAPSALIRYDHLRDTLAVNNGVEHFAGNGLWTLGETVLLEVSFNRNGTSYANFNGAQVIGPVDMGTPSGSIARHRLGANTQGSGFFNGLIGEMIVARDMSNVDKIAARAYLAEKWGV